MEKTRRVTILMNAAIPIAKRGQPASNGWPALLTILSSLLDGMAEADVRLILFNLDQPRELFRKDDFTAKDVRSIAHATDVLARWSVDANVLQSPLGGWDLIRNLETEQIHGSRPDSVIFLGLPAASAQKMPDEMPRTKSTQARLSYLRYRPQSGLDRQADVPSLRGRGGDDVRGARGGRMGELIPRGNPGSGYPQLDPIEQAVRRMGGRTITVSSADELSKAISAVAKSVHEKALK